MRERGFIASTGVTYISTAISVLCMAAFYGVSLRIGTEAFGALQSTMALLFLLFAGRGVAGSYVVIHAAGDARALPGVASRALRIGLLFGLLMAGMFLLLAPIARDFLHMHTSTAFLLIAVACVPAMLSSIVEGILNVQRRFVALAASTMLIPAANLVAALILLRDGFQEADAGWIVLGSQLATCINLLFIDPSVFRSTRAFVERRSSMRELGSLFTASILFGASLRLDIFWARHLLSEQAAGAYTIAASIAIVLFLVTSGTARVASVSLRSGSGRRLIGASYALIAVTSLALAIGFAGIGYPLLNTIAGRTIPIDWSVLTPLFIALTAYSVITFDYTCLNVVTKNVHAGIGVALVVVQLCLLLSFGSDAQSIAWAQCAAMLVMMIIFSAMLLRSVRMRPAAVEAHPAEAHLAQQG